MLFVVASTSRRGPYAASARPALVSPGLRLANQPSCGGQSPRARRRPPAAWARLFRDHLLRLPVQRLARARLVVACAQLKLVEYTRAAREGSHEDSLNLQQPADDVGCRGRSLALLLARLGRQLLPHVGHVTLHVRVSQVHHPCENGSCWLFSHAVSKNRLNCTPHPMARARLSIDWPPKPRAIAFKRPRGCFAISKSIVVDTNGTRLGRAMPSAPPAARGAAIPLAAATLKKHWNSSSYIFFLFPITTARKRGTVRFKEGTKALRIERNERK